VKAGIISLGCSKNLVDTENMLGILKEHGIEITADPAEADIIIVNTCAFIQSAKEESITTVLNMADYKETGHCRSLIVAGCLGQRYRQELLDDMPEVDAIVGTGAWNRIMFAVQETLKGRRLVLAGEDKLLYDEHTPRITTTPKYTAYVKIAEGCNNRCAFCAIPNIRGSYRSRPIEDIKDEVRHLTENGAKEIVLIAQDSTEYGRDLYGEPKLAKLLRELCEVPKLMWLRTLYCYPKYFTDELIQTIAEEPKICKYVDLPMQHADDEVLRHMHRPDTQAEMRTLIHKLRERIPGVSIRSTFLVGFPGETDAQFETLKRFVEEMELDKVGVFTFSREEGTPAYDMPDQVPEEVMQERYHQLMSLQCEISEHVNRRLEGKELDVLVEGRDVEQKNIAVGRSYRDAPGVDGQFYIEGDTDSQPGDVVRVRVLQGFTYDVVGERIDEDGKPLAKETQETPQQEGSDAHDAE
jgi:ribosomal protein S12 methylthiotransferase